MILPGNKRKGVVALILWAGLASLTPMLFAAEKCDIPATMEQVDGRREIRKKFQSEFKARDSAARLELAGKLIETMFQEEKEKNQYGAFVEALEIAIKEKSIGLSMKAIDTVRTRFHINWPVEKTNALEKLGKGIKGKEETEAYVAEVLRVMDSLSQIGFLEEQGKLTKLTKKLVANLKDEASEAGILQKLKELGTRTKEVLAANETGAKKIQDFAAAKIGTQVGDGECTSLAYAALATAGYPSNPWGRRVFPGETPKPGDILVVHDAPEIGVPEAHTMIIKKVFSPFRLGIWHQNTSGVKLVMEGMKDLTGVLAYKWAIYRPGQRD